MSELFSFKSVTLNQDSTISVELAMKSDVAALIPVMDELRLVIRRSGCVTGAEQDVEFALREALENAVIHGNRENPAKRVHITCRCEPSTQVVIAIRDEGNGFDHLRLLDPVRVANVGSKIKRGISLMRLFMDEVYFEQGGTEVHMLKRCNSRRGATFRLDALKQGIPGWERRAERNILEG